MKCSTISSFCFCLPPWPVLLSPKWGQPGSFSEWLKLLQEVWVKLCQVCCQVLISTKFVHHIVHSLCFVSLQRSQMKSLQTIIGKSLRTPQLWAAAVSPTAQQILIYREQFLPFHTFQLNIDHEDVHPSKNIFCLQRKAYWLCKCSQCQFVLPRKSPYFCHFIHCLSPCSNDFILPSPWHSRTEQSKARAKILQTNPAMSQNTCTCVPL